MNAMIDASTFADVDYRGHALRQGASIYIATMFEHYAQNKIRKGIRPISCKRFLQAIDNGEQPEFW